MKVSSISIRNVLGIQERSVECGKITAISGANATGKTSILEAIKATLGRGNLANLTRVGAEDPPETVLVLDDGEYRVERKGGKTKVKKRVGDSAAYEDVPRPQSFLSNLFDLQLSNPVAFLEAAPKDRVELLLAALPIEVDWKALQERIGVWPAGMDTDTFSTVHPLEGLAVLRQALYDERTGVNRSQKDKAASAYELKKTVPARLPEDPEAEITEAEQALGALHAKVAEAKGQQETAGERISGEFKAKAAKRRKTLAEAQAEIRAAAERECAALEAQATEEIEGWRSEAEAAIDAEETRTHEKIAEVQAEIEKVTGDLAALKEVSKGAIRALEAKRTAERFEAESERLKADSERLTEGIDRLDQYRRSLAENLPIEGVEVKDRMIYVEGVPYDQVNTSRKVRLAVEIATLRAASMELPILFVDGAEALDSDHFAALAKELKGAPVQAFLARVTDEPLQIEAVQ